MQQIERERVPTGRANPQPAPARPTATTPASGPTVSVSRFRFTGNTLVPEDDLADAVSRFENRALTFDELQAAAAAVAQRYREAGWVVRTLLPAQEIEAGVVTIEVIESRFGATVFDEPPEESVSARVLRLVRRQLPAGEPVRASAVDRAILLANDLPGVEVAGSLTEGAGPGEVDLLLRLAMSPRFAATAVMDNAGSRSTGANRILLSLVDNAALTVGNQLTGQVLHGRGTDYIRIGYSVPVGPDGWRLGANTSRLNYRVVLPELSALDAAGQSRSTGLEVSYPVVRSRMTNLLMTTTLDAKSFDNTAGATTTSSYRSDALSAGLSAQIADEEGGGVTTLAVTPSVGRLDLERSPNRELIALTTRTDGTFRKLRYAIGRLQPLDDGFTLSIGLTGQYSPGNLDSSEKFFLGGSTGVRAYPSGEAGGVSGHLLTTELRWLATPATQLAAFHDWGHVKVNADNAFPGAPELNRVSRRGVGLSIVWQLREAGLQLAASVSQRVGRNPNANDAGLDQDGSLVRRRLWLSASVAL
jgi:hemolysin activation/secretion protein